MISKKTINSSADIKKIKTSNQSYDVGIISLPVYKRDVFSPFRDLASKNNNLDIKLERIIQAFDKVLVDKGLVFIYGSPVQLIKLYEKITPNLKFRYWVSLDAIDSIEKDTRKHLKHNHIGVLMLTKGKQFLSLNTKETRVSYCACTACKRNVKDWGGKKHLMNTKGSGLSDVWKDFYKIIKTKQDPDRKEIKLNIINPNKQAFKFKNTLPTFILNRILSLAKEEERKVIYLKVGKEFIKPIAHSPSKNRLISHTQKTSDYDNKVLLGDCIKVIERLVKKYPNGLVDLVFADPPYNLSKNYKIYDDDLADKEYSKWCNRWLELCVRLTKPTGSILILNLPKWSIDHAKTLNRFAYLQNWIVWDALSTPKGKIMPAHYALLNYSRKSTQFTFNKLEDIDSLEYCRRLSCIKNRKHKQKLDNKVPITDIWWDIHRIKHKKDRDNHPCQLPDKLMDRIIKMFSNKDDLVFDPFAGAGTTAISAMKHNRKYLTIEIDPLYKKITERKLKEVQMNGHVIKTPMKKKPRSIYTKKGLELKVQNYAKKLKRKPTLKEFLKRYSLDQLEIEKLYGNPKLVLKASRIELLNQKS